MIYRVAVATLLVVNFPAYAAASLLPRADDAAAYALWATALFVFGALWWFAIGALVRRREDTMRRLALCVVAAFVVGGIIGVMLIEIVTKTTPR